VRALTSASLIRTVPSAVAVMTTGKMRRTRSGPPVAVSSSAASNSDSMTNRTASSRLSRGRNRFFSAALAKIEPYPMPS